MRRITLFMLFMLVGCGQSGDLFLPERDIADSTIPADDPAAGNEAESPTEEDDDEETPAG